MKKLVLCDLDKTIIDATYNLNSSRFTAFVRTFQKNGSLIGLNSDTPLVKLLEHQQNWCMNGPTVAELGGIVKFHEEFPIRKTEPFWTDFRRTVAGHLAICSSNCTTVLGDATTIVKNTEYLPGARDGILVLINNLRRVSFSCFVRRITRGKVRKDDSALREISSQIQSLYKQTHQSVCKTEVNEESGIIILHDKQAKKRTALPKLREVFPEHIVFMIGDSINDFLGNESVIHCAVGNASDEFKLRCRFIAPTHLRYTQGVEFLLNKISEFS